MAATLRRSLAAMLGAFGIGQSPNSATVVMGTQTSTVLVRIASSLVITRLLIPEDFGVVLLVTSLFFVIQQLTDTGIPNFVIARPEGDDDHALNTLWTIQLIRGVGLTLVMFMLAPWAATLFGDPESTWAIRITGLSFLLLGIKSMAPMRARRHQREWLNSYLEFGTFLLQTVLTIILAAFFIKSYWAVVIALLARHLLWTILTYTAYSYPLPRLAWDGAVVGALWKFARLIFLSSILSVIIVQFDKFFVLSQFTLANAGIYGLANTTIMAFSSLCGAYFGRVYVADVAKMERNGITGPRAYYEPMRRMRTILIFVAAGGVFFGETLFSLVYDERFAVAGTFFSILVVQSVMLSTTQPAQNYLIALGDTRTPFYANLSRLIWLPVAASWGWAHYQEMGLIWAVALTETPPLLIFYARLIQKGVIQVKEELMPLGALGAGLAAGAIAHTICQLALPASWLS